MRRMVKEKLLRQPLFPERKAHTVPYKLTESESVLYNQVTKYVQDGFIVPLFHFIPVFSGLVRKICEILNDERTTQCKISSTS